MCFGDGLTYKTRTVVKDDYCDTYSTGPRHRRSSHRRHGFGDSYYPPRYYVQPPIGYYTHRAVVHSNHHSQPAAYEYQYGHPRIVNGANYGGTRHGHSGYHTGGRAVMPRTVALDPAATMEAFPKPRHQYIYTPRYGQRGILSYAGQVPNGAAPTGVMGGVAYGMGVAPVVGGFGVRHRSYTYTTPYTYGSYYASPYTNTYPSRYGAAYPTYGLAGSLYPFANLYSPFQRTYVPTVPYTTVASPAYVVPPGPSGTTTTTTTYHVTNSSPPPIVTGGVQTNIHVSAATTREDLQAESRKVASQRGAYQPRAIRPADARADDPFWCRERNGDWHLRSYYQIENECQPGRWLIDDKDGFLMFHRD